MIVKFILDLADGYVLPVIISNRVSELRVVELLDGLCEQMQDYTLEKVILMFVFDN